MSELFYIKKNDDGKMATMQRVKIEEVEIPLSDLNPDPEQLCHREFVTEVYDGRKLKYQQVCKRGRIITTIKGDIKWGGIALEDKVTDNGELKLVSEQTTGLFNDLHGSSVSGYYGNNSQENKDKLNEKFIEFYLEDVVLTCVQTLGDGVGFKIKNSDGLTPRLPNIYADGNICAGEMNFNRNAILSAKFLISSTEANIPNFDLMQSQFELVKFYEKNDRLYATPHYT